MKKINAAVIGLGRMGRTHVSAAKDSPYIHEVYGHEPDSELCSQRASELGIIPIGFEELLASKDISLVYIASPNACHLPQATAALRAGKAVLCEKPMGEEMAEARQILRVADETGGFLQVGFELRYSRLYQQAKEWIDAGIIGDPVNIQLRYYCCEFHGKESWRSNSRGSFLVCEKLSHYLDLQRWWFGASPESIYSVAAPKVVPYFQHEDNHQMIMRFPGGKVGTLNFIMYIAESLHRDPLMDVLAKQSDDGHFLQFHICGTRGAIEGDAFQRRLRRWEFTDGAQGLESQIVDTIIYPGSEDNLWIHNTYGQNLRIAELVATGLPPEATPHDAFETMKLCFAAVRSEETGQIVALRDL